MRKIPFIIALLLTASSVSAQQQFTTHIEPLRNEKWWGYFAGGGPAQPFTEAFSKEMQGNGVFTVSFMLSDQGRYVWSAYPFEVVSDGQSFTVTSGDTPLEAAKGGKTLREAYLSCVHREIWPHTGGPANHLFPLPVYDTALATVTAADSETLLAMADSLLESGFPAGTLLIPDGWQETSPTMGFDKNLFRSFPQTASSLRERGFGVMLTVTPYLPAAGRGYVDAARAGILLEDGKGHPAIIHTSAGYYVCLDLTQPAVVEIMNSRLADLAEAAGAIPLYFECRHALELLPAERREEYMRNWVMLGERFNAAMYPLDSCAPIQWHPYSVSPVGELSWGSLAETLSRIIDAGITGHIYPYLSLAGADTSEDEELLLRALQLAVYMPLPAIPPSDDMLNTDKYRRALRQTLVHRRSMDDYMDTLLHETLTTGEPVLRSMEYQFPHQGFSNCHDQYMLGSKYLVAPVLGDAEQRIVRLPRGMWTAQDGTKFRGPRVISVDVSDGRMPVFRLR